jgi:hypothetical protein
MIFVNRAAWEKIVVRLDYEGGTFMMGFILL